jgi:hypothetical protein
MAQDTPSAEKKAMAECRLIDPGIYVVDDQVIRDGGR